MFSGSSSSGEEEEEDESLDGLFVPSGSSAMESFNNTGMFRARCGLMPRLAVALAAASLSGVDGAWTVGEMGLRTSRVTCPHVSCGSQSGGTLDER